jgi:hypothetical protein
VVTVYVLELLCKGRQGQVSFLHIVLSDSVLVHETHAIDKLAEVGVIYIREHTIKKTRAQAIEIKRKLPGLVPTR